ncbi:hypothetical protein KEM09_14495 [Carboxylicivirga mesophila]|uniref:Uncharacterized protein n=1 Tax=Carboxylicivirga mesophila TaxID=1166478 RepID=A0ABS5KC54_9BACT|nr:hypothetical protein [Carboxylicivirga mesophila]MBS2212624.1 hypothetical protein [Carboxylicivirga mesophila]
MKRIPNTYKLMMVLAGLLILVHFGMPHSHHAFNDPTCHMADDYDDFEHSNHSSEESETCHLLEELSFNNYNFSETVLPDISFFINNCLIPASEQDVNRQGTPLYEPPVIKHILLNHLATKLTFRGPPQPAVAC